MTKRIHFIGWLLLGLTLWFSGTLHAQDSTAVKKKKERKRGFAIYPAIGYQPETKFQFGAIAFITFNDDHDPDDGFNRESSISPYFLYTLNNQVLTALDFDLFFKNGMNLKTVFRYFSFPDKFFGIGNDTNVDSVENYTDEFIRLDGRLFKPIHPKVFAGLGYDLQRNWIYGFEEGGRLETEDIVGKNGGTLIGLGPTARYDTRNDVIYPTRGSLLTGEILFYTGDFKFVSYLIDLRKYLSIVSEKNILAFQLYMNFTSGGSVPFYKLPKIGGDERMRGIANANLYKDNQAMYVQVEYRRDLFWRFGGVAFASFGDVAPRIGDFDISEFKYTVGVGGRFAAIKDEKLNIRLDVGLSTGGNTAFYIAVREAF